MSVLTERQELHRIRLMIENLLIKPIKEEPPLLIHYNQITQGQYRYHRKNLPGHPSNRNAKNMIQHVKMLKKSGERSRTPPTKAFTDSNNQKSSSYKSPLKRNRPQEKTTPTRTRSITPFRKEANLTRSKSKSKSKVINEPAEELSKPNLEHIRMRYGQLVTLAMRNTKQRRSNISSNNKRKVQDADQLKKQLQQQLGRYIKAIKHEKIGQRQREAILTYINQIMDKFECLIT